MVDRRTQGTILIFLTDRGNLNCIKHIKKRKIMCRSVLYNSYLIHILHILVFNIDIYICNNILTLKKLYISLPHVLPQGKTCQETQGRRKSEKMQWKISRIRKRVYVHVNKKISTPPLIFHMFETAVVVSIHSSTTLFHKNLSNFHLFNFRYLSWSINRVTRKQEATYQKIILVTH